MDLTSILPLIMGNKNPEMAKILSAMNGSKSDGGMNDILASILANQNKGQNNGSNDKKSDSDAKANPFSAFMGGGAGGQAEIFMNLMNSMNKQKKPKKVGGLSVIQTIAPNDILGVMLKYFNTRR